jgi:hypothetical protein
MQLKPTNRRTFSSGFLMNARPMVGAAADIVTAWWQITYLERVEVGVCMRVSVCGFVAFGLMAVGCRRK